MYLNIRIPNFPSLFLVVPGVGDAVLEWIATATADDEQRVVAPAGGAVLWGRRQRSGGVSGATVEQRPDVEQRFGLHPCGGLDETGLGAGVVEGGAELGDTVVSVVVEP